MSHITTCTTCGKLYEEFSEESASAPNKRECLAEWFNGANVTPNVELRGCQPHETEKER